MKKLSILFVSILTLGLTAVSCSSDDDKDGGSIEGKWEVTHQGAILNGQEVIQPYDSEGCEIPSMTFTNDGKFIDITSEYWDSKCSTYTEDGTWKKDGNTLTLKYSDEEVKWEISELSSSTLKVKMTYSEGGISVSAVSIYKKK
ncbi:lipocalin family protein [Flavobacterium anhuiense]|uniref:Lipocalin_4 domain containing protein n=1 Tax=Flavobacterium anhuiense TaxID=459526 RepID=A0A444VUQ1_9FLAO|nr:lipocalin family protein [Flavobacterium anhuiense]RYJ37210.1 Lipocalin_4 domain containing protein [Flavobacterium anhuiense]